MSDPSFRDNFFTRFTFGLNDAKQRSRQLFDQILDRAPTESFETTQKKALSFLEEYHSLLFHQQSLLSPSEEPLIYPLKIRTAELILKQVNLYYLPFRLESLIPYCDPFTAVGTFLNALHLSYDELLQNPHEQMAAQALFQEFIEIDQYELSLLTEINEIPLYQAASPEELEHFQETAFAFRRALDIVKLLEQIQPRNYQNRKRKILQNWHQEPTERLEKIIQELNQ